MGDLDKIEQAAAGPDNADKAAAVQDKFELVTAGPDKVEQNKVEDYDG